MTSSRSAEKGGDEVKNRLANWAWLLDVAEAVALEMAEALIRARKAQRKKRRLR